MHGVTFFATKDKERLHHSKLAQKCQLPFHACMELCHQHSWVNFARLYNPLEFLVSGAFSFDHYYVVKTTERLTKITQFVFVLTNKILVMQISASETTNSNWLF
jgi:hypothetical protein